MLVSFPVLDEVKHSHGEGVLTVIWGFSSVFLFSEHNFLIRSHSVLVYQIKSLLKYIYVCGWNVAKCKKSQWVWKLLQGKIVSCTVQKKMFSFGSIDVIFYFFFQGSKVLQNDEFTKDLFRFLQLLCEGHNGGEDGIQNLGFTKKKK